MMLKKTARRFLSVRSGSAAAWTSTTFILFSVLFSLATVLSCASFAADQMIKAAVVSTTLESTSFRRWSQDLGYQETQLYPLTLGASGCPFVGVDVSGIKLPLMLDSGTARGFVITNQAPSIPHRVEERIEELNADGSHRGESFRIRVETDRKSVV